MSDPGAALLEIIDQRVREVVKEIMGEYTSPEAARLTAKYGSLIPKGEAKNILGVAPSTIWTMCRDGRLEERGNFITTASIARHLDEGRPTAQAVKRRNAARQPGRFERIAP